MEKNIYIHALEYGYNNINGGVSYTQMKAELKKIKEYKLLLETHFETYFHIWFYKHFFMKDVTALLISGDRLMEIKFQMNHPLESSLDDLQIHLMEKGYNEYLDFLKLEQARIDTQKAHELSITAIKWSRVAVYISAGMALIQILLELYLSGKFCK